jgi:Mg2+-importing ATPase
MHTYPFGWRCNDNSKIKTAWNSARGQPPFNSEGSCVILTATRVVADKDVKDIVNLQGLSSDMALEGLFTFLDPPKDDAEASIAQLQAIGVDVRILTGDNLGVAMKIYRSLEVVKEINEENVPAITGQALAQLEDEENTTV